tara:strand:+ start:6747 stop:8051 length:1305 start_codon:yes stop_codon:yes gene_type:complete
MKKFLLFFLLSLNLNAQAPNIVYILVDDLGYGDLSSYGASDINTPAIDKLAKEGKLFTRAYANSTVCSPSRAAILSGNYPDRVGVPGVIRQFKDNDWGNLVNDFISLPQALKTSGYKTALIGKWHLGLESPDIPNERGFDYFKGFLGDMMDDYNNHLRGGVNWMRENLLEISPKGHATDLFTQWSIDYIEKNKSSKNPFFLFLNYNAPHSPIQPPEKWLSSVIKRERNSSEGRQKLIAFIEHLDDSVDKVINSLENNNLLDNTIIIFTSDNGGALHYSASNKPFNGGKGNMLEGGIRIPCIVKWSNVIKPGVVNDPIMLMDFYPTLVSISREFNDYNLPSKNILPLLKDEELSYDSRFMVWIRREGHVFGGRDFYAISNGRFKLLQNSPFEPYKLYDLEKDPFEENPIENKEVKSLLLKKLTKHIQVSGNIPWQ